LLPHGDARIVCGMQMLRLLLSSRIRSASLALAAALALSAGTGCSDDQPLGSGGSGGSLSSSTGTGAGGHGGSSSSSTGTGMGGAGGGPSSDVEAILAELRADRDAAMHKYASQSGWPVKVTGGYLFVCTEQGLNQLAGDHDDWTGEPMNGDTGFQWLVRDVAAGDKYKFTNGSDFHADAWSRSYTYDSFGEISLVAPTAAHLDRYFDVADATLPPRMVRVWVPVEKPTHVLYVHDGQNLFDPQAAWGGWHLQDSAPPAMLLVGIDNTGENRMNEYTHVQDMVDLNGDGVDELWGGQGDAYADFVQKTVRPLIADHYGEPAKLGTMGSSLGGLIAFHIADRYPGVYAFAASLSGTMGWGKIGAKMMNQTMIERYQKHGFQGTVLYLDAGGGDAALSQAANEAQCADTDGDGIKDDVEIGDNACENAQMRDTLVSVGYTLGTDVFHWWQPGAQHNEAEWKARAFRPLDLFKSL
jgi:predicted alpha/beta superfamily hydrolase